MGQRLLVRNNQAPGDIIVLSAALRDLALAHPDRYNIEVSVSKGAEHVFWHNPSVSRIHPVNVKVDGRGAISYRAHYPLIKSCNQQRKHFILGFIEHMNSTLDTKIKLTKFQPHIVMSEAEKATRPFDEPYWVFLSGGKKDYPTKIWAQTYWQRVINATKDRVNWVQCGGGSSSHIMHKAKDGIFANMIAKTDCRNFLRLIYHSEGVVCVTTMAMHAAAAFNKPCIVIEGGREPYWWEGYTSENRLINMRLYDPSWKPPANDDFVAHKFLHTIGKLKCCRNHGCWRKRVLGGGNVCRDTTVVDGQTLPKCKAMISPEMVIAGINEYLDAGLARRVTDAKTILVPATTMRTPEGDVPVVVQAPVLPAPKELQLPPAALSSVRFCLFGDDVKSTIQGPKVYAVPAGLSRVAALHCLLESTEDWIVWVEDGVKLHPSWMERLLPLLTHPAVIGRAHRTRGGLLYPYPVCFAVHRSLLRAADTFGGSFSAVAKNFKDWQQVVSLTAEHRAP